MKRGDRNLKKKATGIRKNEGSREGKQKRAFGGCPVIALPSRSGSRDAV